MRIDLLLTGVLTLGSLTEEGSAEVFCKKLYDTKPEVVILESGGGSIIENYKAVQCLRSTDTIVKVKQAHSAAAFFMHGIPYKCLHPKVNISLHNPYHADKGESLEITRQVYKGLLQVYQEWGVPEEKVTMTLFVSIMTPSDTHTTVEPVEAAKLYGSGFCAVGGG